MAFNVANRLDFIFLVSKVQDGKSLVEVRLVQFWVVSSVVVVEMELVVVLCVKVLKIVNPPF